MINSYVDNFGLRQVRGEEKSIIYLALMAALILMSYGLARGPSEALFMREFSHTLLPGLWIEVGVSVICVVALYNYLLRFFELRAMFLISSTLTGLSLLGILYGGWGGEAQIIELGGIQFPIGNLTLLRLWCDLYIVVFVETYWSMANLRFPLKKATYIYGLLCAAGTIGSVVSNTWVASRSLSPETYIFASFWTIPLLAILNELVNRHWRLVPASDETQELHTDQGSPVNQRAQSPKRRTASAKSGLIEGIRLIFKSRYLIWILALVLLAQITVALIDYEYKRMLRDWYVLQPELMRQRELYQALDWSGVYEAMRHWGDVLLYGGELPSLDFTLFGERSGELVGERAHQALEGAQRESLRQALTEAFAEATRFYEHASVNMSSIQGWMYLSIDVGALLSQVCTGWIILRLGIAGTHMSIPLLLITVLSSVIIWPTLLLIAAARSAAKFLTYSIFKSAKELLYVPLTYDEQTQGKAIIDIMVYRQAKILASVLLLPAVGIVALGVNYLALSALVLWIFVVWRLRDLIQRVD